MGFNLDEEHGPDYSYVKQYERVSKQSCQKKNLMKKGAQGTMANTERELALTLDLHRIWDCGKKAWSLDLTKQPILSPCHTLYLLPLQPIQTLMQP